MNNNYPVRQSQSSSYVAQAISWTIGAILRMLWRLLKWVVPWAGATVIWLAFAFYALDIGAPWTSWILGVVWLVAGVAVYVVTTRMGAHVWRRSLVPWFPLVDLAWLVHGRWRLASKVMADDLDWEDRRFARSIFKHWPGDALGVGLATRGADGKIIAPPIMRISNSPKGLVLEVSPLLGQSVNDFIDRTDVLARALGSPLLQVSPAANGLNAKIVLVDRDPLNKVFEVTPDELTLNPEKMSVCLGTDENGDLVNIKLAGHSGLVIGGVPGSGKTAALTTLILPLLLSDLAQVHVFDGKGGLDLAWVKPRAATFVNDDKDLGAVVEKFRAIQSAMQHRLSSVPEGQPSNFWNRDRTSAEPLITVVVDEAQTYLDSMGEPDKTRKTQLIEISAILTDLVKRGRSAGVVVILLTQKPTSDSLPTRIRDNCSLRVCFRVTTAEAEKAVLGVAPDDCDVRATSIAAAQVGVGVVADDRGGRRLFRALYCPENLAAEAVAKG